MWGTTIPCLLFAYGSAVITETKLQTALGPVCKEHSIFDSKFDTGLAAVNGNLGKFSQFHGSRKCGKAGVFIASTHGAGCQGLSPAPEFDIDPNSPQQQHHW